MTTNSQILFFLNTRIIRTVFNFSFLGRQSIFGLNYDYKIVNKGDEMETYGYKMEEGNGSITQGKTELIFSNMSVNCEQQLPRSQVSALLILFGLRMKSLINTGSAGYKAFNLTYTMIKLSE